MSEGTFDRIEVLETSTRIRVRVLLRGAKTNQPLGPDDPKCTIAVAVTPEVVSLRRAVGNRRVVDGSCDPACRIPVMRPAQRRALIDFIT